MERFQVIFQRSLYFIHFFKCNKWTIGEQFRRIVTKAPWSWRILLWTLCQVQKTTFVLQSLRPRQQPAGWHLLPSLTKSSIPGTHKLEGEGEKWLAINCSLASTCALWCTPPYNKIKKVNKYKSQFKMPYSPLIKKKETNGVKIFAIRKYHFLYNPEY